MFALSKQEKNTRRCERENRRARLPWGGFESGSVRNRVVHMDTLWKRKSLGTLAHVCCRILRVTKDPLYPYRIGSAPSLRLCY